MDKSSIVLEIGSKYTKCGFSPESIPRFIIPTQFTPLNLNNYLSSGISYDESDRINNNKFKLPTFQQLYESLFTFINQLYFKYLLCKPEDRKVIIVENLNIPRAFREALVTVLFEHFKVPLIVFMNPTTCLVPLLKNTALIVDCGYSESRVLPVFEGIGVIKSYENISLGFQSLEIKLKDWLLSQKEEESSPLILNSTYQIPQNSLKIIETLLLENSNSKNNNNNNNNDFIEDIIIKTCLALSSRSNDEPLPGISNTRYRLNKQYSLMIHHQIRSGLVSRFFESEEDVQERDLDQQIKESFEEGNLASTILDSLLSCEVDQRKALSHNILIVGGTSMIPGFKSRLIQEMKKQIRYNTKYSGLKGLESHFNYIKHNFQPNYMMWLGASLLGSVIEHIPTKISLETFISFPASQNSDPTSNKRVMVLPEWEKVLPNTSPYPPTTAGFNPLQFPTSLFSPVTSSTDLSHYLKNKPTSTPTSS